MSIIRTKTFRRRRRAQQSVLAELASRVREAYIEERRLWECRKGLRGDAGESSPPWTPGRYWDGGKIRLTGKVMKPYWPRVVRFLLEHKVTDFRAYIAAQFSARSTMGPVPTPQYLVGDKALRVWKKHREAHAASALKLGHSLSCQKQVLARALLARHEELPHLSPERVRRGVLLDTDLPLTALFRYCLAISEGLDEIARVYELAAETEFLADRESYCSAWKDWIPEALKENAGQVLACLIKEIDRA